MNAVPNVNKRWMQIRKCCRSMWVQIIKNIEWNLKTWALKITAQAQILLTLKWRLCQRRTASACPQIQRRTADSKIRWTNLSWRRTQSLNNKTNLFFPSRTQSLTSSRRQPSTAILRANFRLRTSRSPNRAVLPRGWTFWMLKTQIHQRRTRRCSIKRSFSSLTSQS